jgi:hypothetical protein
MLLQQHLQVSTTSLKKEDDIVGAVLLNVDATALRLQMTYTTTIKIIF